MLLPVRANERGLFAQFLSYLPSPVRAKERGACAVFTAPRAEISSPERAAHLPSMARAKARSLAFTGEGK